MSEAHTKALELANQHVVVANVRERPDETVARATAYHAFLTSAAAGQAKPATQTQTNKPAATTTQAAKPASAQAAPAATAAKPPASAATQTAPKAATPAAAKPTAAKPAAAKPAAAAAKPTGDTKDSAGKNTFDDVVTALRKYHKIHGKDATVAFLSKVGGGVGSVHDLKPTKYDAVVNAVEQALNPPKATAAGTVVVTDELGDPVDTSGASAATAGESDPPEGGSGEEEL